MRARVTAVITLAMGLAACGSDNNETVPVAAETTPESISLTLLGRYSTGSYNTGAAEIVAYDAASKRAFVVNGDADTVDVLSLANPAAPVKVGTLDLDLLGLDNVAAGTDGDGIRSPNSVAVYNGLVAVAVEDAPKTNVGKVGLYNASTLALVGQATVGALPDMLTFTPDGTKVLVANEGEPAGYLAADADPEGSVSVVNVAAPGSPTVQTVGFTSLDGQTAKLRNAGIRIFGPTGGAPANAKASTDFEPEYIAVSPNGQKAYVSLQENNALATIDLSGATPTLVDVVPLGTKNHALVGNALDASDRDGLLTSGNSAAIRIINRPLLGMYMPDAIAVHRIGGQDYIVTANEGDAREYAGLLGGTTSALQREDVRLSAVDLDDTRYPDEASLKSDVNLGRLRVSLFSGDAQGVTPVTGAQTYEQIHAFGARSFSLFRPSGNLVFDSGSDFEDITASDHPLFFNTGHEVNTLDDRSPAKGPEPEALALATFGDKTFAFIGLERDSGIMIYDVTDPAAPVFENYTLSRDFAQATNTAGAGDLGPEGFAVVAAADSPTGKPLLLVANEVSGTTTIYTIDLAF